MFDLLTQFVSDQSKWDQTIQGGNAVLWFVLTNFLTIPGIGN